MQMAERPSRRLAFQARPVLLKAVNAAARASGMTRAEFVRSALRKALKAQGPALGVGVEQAVSDE